MAKSLEIKELVEALEIKELESNNELDDEPSSFNPDSVKVEQENVKLDYIAKQAQN